MSMDGRYPENAGAIFRVCFGWTANFCSCKIGIPAFHGGRILKMQEQFSGYVLDGRLIFAPAKLAFPPSMAFVSR